MKRNVACAVLWLVLIHPVRAGCAGSWQAKVEPTVLQSAQIGETEFIVILNEQADVSGAWTLNTKQAKGAHVIGRLTEVAQRTQRPILELLKSRGLNCRPFWIANAIWVRGNLAALQALGQRTEVARILNNPTFKVAAPLSMAGTADTAVLTGVQWNLAQVRAPDVWALGYFGQGAVVAEIDSGFQWNVPALINHYRGYDGVTTNHNYNWHDAVHSGNVACGPDSRVPCDDDGHGTHTMGIIVGDDGGTNQIGMAPGAKWIGCRGWDNNFNGTVDAFIECFQWLVNPTDLDGLNPDPTKAPDVINNSWHCTVCSDPLLLTSIVNNVRAAGIVVVAVTPNIYDANPPCATINYGISMYDTALTTGATDENDIIATWSGRGPVTVDNSNRIKPDICAPGVDVRSCLPSGSYSTSSYTSHAGPHVAGLVALMLSAHPELKGQVDAIERLIEQTAVPLTSPDGCGGLAATAVPNNSYGWGRIDALAALGLTDSVGDGIPDWWRIWHFGGNGKSTNSLSCATCDPSGIGQNNLFKYLAGLNPTNPASAFRITALTPQGADVRLNWQAGAGRTNVVQASANAGGIYSNISPNIFIPGHGDATTNLLLLGASTNHPPRFYRIQLVH